MIGVAGFKLSGRGLFEPDEKPFLEEYGQLSGTIRMIGLALLDREERQDELLMDGIAVAPEACGSGIGTRLLEEIIALAGENDAGAVRLDVIDTNPRAKALYQRMGFVAEKTTRLYLSRLIFPFSAYTRMRRAL